MKKWGLGLMLVAVLAAPALACGFPLPAGTTMMAVSKAVCAEGETPDSCQLRQDAYQMMGKLQAVAISDLQAEMLVDTGTEKTEMSITGQFEYQVTDSEIGLGANVHALIDTGQVAAATGTQTLDDTEFIVVEDKGYTSKDGGQTWTYEEFDKTTMLGLSLLLGLAGTTGSGLDLYYDPGIFSVAAGEDVDMDGQTMHVQTLAFNLEALLSNPEAIMALMENSSGVLTDMGVSLEDLGDPAQVAMLAPILLPAFEGTLFTTTLYIGADDGYIHRIEENFVFVLDSSKIMFGTEGQEEPTMMLMTYQLSGTLTAFNEPLAIAAPEDASEGAGLLGDEGGLFGGNLSDSLFGGQ